MKNFKFDIVQYGIFHSEMKFQNITVTSPRTVGFFEFEFFTADTDRNSYINGKAIPLRRGTLICAKPGQLRYSQLHFRCHYLHITSEDENFLRLMESLPDSINIEEVDGMTEMFEALLKIDDRLPQSGLQLEGEVCRLLARIVRLADMPVSEDNPAIHTYRKALQNAASYIKHHLSDKLTLEKLAQVANLSPIYFHRLFTEKFGKTPNLYILEHRIAAAKLALLSDNISISEIAADCGFSTQSYFNHKFKQATGKTPLEYRRYMLGRLKL